MLKPFAKPHTQQTPFEMGFQLLSKQRTQRNPYFKIKQLELLFLRVIDEKTKILEFSSENHHPNNREGLILFLLFVGIIL